MPQSRPPSVPPARDPRPARLLATGVSALLALTGAGCLGFATLEGLSLADALYLTVTTLSTVGYGDVVPITARGRWLAVGLIVAGIGAVFYTAVALAEFLLEGHLREALGRRSVKQTIDSLRDHVVVCGYGRLGRAVAEKLREGNARLVVIDEDPAVGRTCEAQGHLFVPGSALDDAVLESAGVRRARAIVAATPSDPDNVFITLSAREAHPGIQVHARAQTEAGSRRLQLAGADQVISPYVLGGQRIANAIVRPGVVEFLELAAPGVGGEVDLEEVLLPEGSGVDGVRLRDLADRGLRISVVAIKRGDEPIRIQPTADDELRAGDHVIVVGERESLKRLSALVGSD